MVRGLPESIAGHFLSERFVGEPAGGHDLRGEARNAACGDHLVLYLAIEGGIEVGMVRAAGFRARGCPATMAMASAACSVLPGLPLAGLEEAFRASYVATFGAPPAAHRHVLMLCSEALVAAREGGGAQGP